MLLASYVDDDVGWVVPLWREDDPASSLSLSAKATQNRNYCHSSVQTFENIGFFFKTCFQIFVNRKITTTVWNKTFINPKHLWSIWQSEKATYHRIKT